MSNPAVTDFMNADFREQLRQCSDGTVAPEVIEYVGADAVDRMKQLHGQLDEEHLAPSSTLATAQNPMVLCPGIMGSWIHDVESTVYWIDKMHLPRVDDLRLEPDGINDTKKHASFTPFGLDPVYAPFRTAALRRPSFFHRPFPYDWRKMLSESADDLLALVTMMHDKSGRPVHLVGHSMGGLMIRAAIREHGSALWDKVGRVVFIGTPHYGSPAIAGYLKNHLWGWDGLGVLAAFLSRGTFRSLWGLLSLLPAPSGVYPGTRDGEPHPCANFDMYNAGAWELGLGALEQQRLQVVLDSVAAYHRDLFAFHRTMDPGWAANMLMIAGVGFKSLFRLELNQGFFNTTEEIMRRKPGDDHREGDGRVSLASAELEGVTCRYICGEHGGLTSIPAVWKDTFEFLRHGAAGTVKLHSTPAGALSQHLAAGDDEKSAAPELDGSSGRDAQSDDPGYLDTTPPDAARIEALREQARQGKYPGIQRIRLL